MGRNPGKDDEQGRANGRDAFSSVQIPISTQQRPAAAVYFLFFLLPL